MGFWGLFSPVATGQKVRKMSKNRHFWRFWRKTAFLAVFTRKRPFWAFLALRGGLFYINPSRRGPVVPARGSRGTPGWGSPHRGEGRIPSPSGRVSPEGSGRGQDPTGYRDIRKRLGDKP